MGTSLAAYELNHQRKDTSLHESTSSFSNKSFKQ